MIGDRRGVPPLGRLTAPAMTITRCSVLALGLIAVNAALASPASAAVPGLERVTATSASTSGDKSARATCPSGKRVLGTGGEITGGLGQVVLDDITPDSALTSVSVLAREDQDGTANNWSVTAYAICANPIAGLERVTATRISNSVEFLFAEARCTGGKRVLGAGGDITGGLGQVVLDGVVPDNNLRLVTVSGREDQDGTPSNWSVRAYAICANPIDGLQGVSSASAFNSFDKGATATCPSGTRVLSAGGFINFGDGQVVLDDLTPNSTLTSVTLFGREDQDGTAGNWVVDAVAVCASP
jgi:hypothetical protein